MNDTNASKLLVPGKLLQLSSYPYIAMFVYQQPVLDPKVLVGRGQAGLTRGQTVFMVVATLSGYLRFRHMDSDNPVTWVFVLPMDDDCPPGWVWFGHNYRSYDVKEVT